MTAARRALPTEPTRLQRLGALLTSTARYDRLVSAVEDQADRLDARSRQLGGERSLRGLDHAQAADDLRRILQEHT